MKSFKIQTSAFVLFGVIVSAPFAFADKKDDLYKKGSDAVGAGDAIGAKAAYCQLAAEDAEYKDAKALCATYTTTAEKTLTRYKFNYADGQELMSKGDYDAAEIKFKNVKAGDYADLAKQRIAEIAKLKQAKKDADSAASQNAAVESQMKQRLDQGVNAFNAGDFNTAKSALSAVTGTHQADAQAILGKIRNYESKMNEGNALRDAKNYTAAAAAYTAAMQINGSGPGNPAGEFANAVRLSATATATSPTNNPSPNVVKQAPPAVKIDVARYLAEGQKALAKNDFKKARHFFQEVQAQDKNNQEANDGLKEIGAKDTTQAVATEDDSIIRTVIDSFYKGSFDEVEYRLNDYIYNHKGKKLGLANFYVGASLLTRYYLGGGSDENLRKQAREKFKAAKEVEGFKAPDKFISPKIMKVFEAS